MAFDLDTGRAAFEASADFTVGLEEEFALLDPLELGLVQRFHELYEAGGRDPVLSESLSGELISSEIEIRSGVLATAGGVVFTALQDGWVVAYDDEKLEELWRFNVGTPLKGAPVTYAIGPKQYLAVQSSGRHLHPVKYDRLETSSYLFVFALN